MKDKRGLFRMHWNKPYPVLGLYVWSVILFALIPGVIVGILSIGAGMFRVLVLLFGVALMGVGVVVGLVQGSILWMLRSTFARRSIEVKTLHWSALGALAGVLAGMMGVFIALSLFPYKVDLTYTTITHMIGDCLIGAIVSPWLIRRMDTARGRGLVS
jgi:hypothetical protein